MEWKSPDSIPDKLEKNVVCRICGERLFRKDNREMSTMLCFTYEEGHNHDDNCITRSYCCKNGHARRLSIVNSCDSCDWKGKIECFCCVKVMKWPEQVETTDE